VSFYHRSFIHFPASPQVLDAKTRALQSSDKGAIDKIERLFGEVEKARSVVIARDVDDPDVLPSDSPAMVLRKQIEHKVITINVILSALRREAGEKKSAEELKVVVTMVKLVQAFEKTFA
jgi:hypothetical protein